MPLSSSLQKFDGDKGKKKNASGIKSKNEVVKQKQKKKICFDEFVTSDHDLGPINSCSDVSRLILKFNVIIGQNYTTDQGNRDLGNNLFKKALDMYKTSEDDSEWRQSSK